MGFFGSFNAIGKIYSHLRKIEPMFNELQRAMYNHDYDYTNNLTTTILQCFMGSMLLHILLYQKSTLDYLQSYSGSYHRLIFVNT